VLPAGFTRAVTNRQDRDGVGVVVDVVADEVWPDRHRANVLPQWLGATSRGEAVGEEIKALDGVARIRPISLRAFSGESRSM
jgi:hypothetical protein